MQYALLLYGNIDARDRRSAEEWQTIQAGTAEVMARSDVTGYLRLQQVESATTTRPDQHRTLVTDGPFVDSKDYLGGFVVVEAENLDGALAVADELHALRMATAIEIRPVNEEPLASA